MKKILISVRPKWCEKICHKIGKDENGKPIYEKRIEMRKTAPKEVPFKACIYMTKSRENDIYKRYKVDDIKSGKVIGEFICDKVEMVNAKCSDYGIDLFYHDCLTNGCLTEREIEKYFNIPEDKDLRVMKGNGYVWHISDLKIYDKPKELSEFKTGCKGCKERDTYHCKFYCYGERPLTRPPQSWQYVDEVKE